NPAGGAAGHGTGTGRGAQAHDPGLGTGKLSRQFQHRGAKPVASRWLRPAQRPCCSSLVPRPRRTRPRAGSARSTIRRCLARPEFAPARFQESSDSDTLRGKGKSAAVELGYCATMTLDKIIDPRMPAVLSPGRGQPPACKTVRHVLVLTAAH